VAGIMPITYQVLGTPDSDNALLVALDSGHEIQRLLFDCGDRCVSTLKLAEIQAIDHLLFSHLHMDHVGGFDNFFRATFDCATRRHVIWGPPDTARILQHRFQGYLWNLCEDMAATWEVREVHPGEVRPFRFELSEGFAICHAKTPWSCQGLLLKTDAFTVETIAMDHHTPSLAYVVREKPHHNVDVTRLAALGLKPGAWLKRLKEPGDDQATIEVGGQTRTIGELRQALVVETPGDSIAYLTDFLLDDAAIERLAGPLQGCRTIVCESQYRQADWDLARRNYHMTTVRSATLAKRVQATDLVLFHLSARYERSEWAEMLREAQQVFPAARYPEHWKV
jgi:ribonuclease Z